MWLLLLLWCAAARAEDGGAKSRHHVINRDFFVAEKFRDGLFRHDLVLEGSLAEDVPDENELAEVVLAPFDCVKVVRL